MTVDGIRARNRAAIEAEILRIGGEHLARDGAAALSLRAIARDLGMAPSALYRYVASRDDLLTLLIIEAYNDQADAAEAALSALPPDAAPMARFRTIARAVRAWAQAQPHRYALIYGSPVPDYHAPAERTTYAGTRIPRLLITSLVQLEPPAPDPRAEATLAGLLAEPEIRTAGLSGAALQRGLTAWILVLGAITTELFEQFGPNAFTDADAFFEAVLDSAELVALGA